MRYGKLPVRPAPRAAGVRVRVRRSVRLLPRFSSRGSFQSGNVRGVVGGGEVTWCVWVVSRRSCSWFCSTGGGGDGVSYGSHRGERQETNMEIPSLIACRLVRTRTSRQTAQGCGGSPGIRQPGEVRPEDPCPSRLTSTYTYLASPRFDPQIERSPTPPLLFQLRRRPLGPPTFTFAYAAR